MRKAVQITGAAVFAAVLMTGCSKSSDGGDKKVPATPPAAADSQAPAAGGASSAPAGGTTGSVDGAWGAAQSADGAVGLSIHGAKGAVVNGKHICPGEVNQSAKPVTLTLKCNDGDTTRSQGTIVSSDGKSLTVSWASGRKDTFVKADGAGAAGGAGQLPDLSKIGH